MDDVIARIKHKLAYLQQHDNGDVTEASRDRQYQIRNHYPFVVDAPHTEEEIASFEIENEIQLPEDYRRFVLEVGRSGANPGYDLYSPLDEDCLPGSTDNLRQPFPFDNTMDYEDIERFGRTLGLSPVDGEDEIDFTQIECLFEGALWLVYEGCQCWYMLIITGVARGQIWFTDVPFFTPMLLRDGEPVHTNQQVSQAERLTFTQWYEAWLNKQIRIAQEHWHKRGRTVPPLSLPAE